MKFIYFLLLLNGIKSIVFAVQKCEKDFFKTTYRTDNGEEKDVLLIWFPIYAGSDSKLNLCSNETGLPLQRHCFYHRTLSSSYWEDVSQNISLVSCSHIFRQCLEEPFTHNYIMKNGVLKRHQNKWKTTQMMERADLQDPCLQSSGLSLTRRCGYNPNLLRAEWEPINKDLKDISCLKEIQEDIVTYKLNSLHKELRTNISYSENLPENKYEYKFFLNRVSKLLKTSNVTLVPADIKITSEILKLVITNNQDPSLVPHVLNISDIIMDMDPVVVRKSEKVNATVVLLNTIENYLHNMAKKVVPTNLCNIINDGIVYNSFKHASVFYVNPSCSNISGIAIFNSKRHNYDRNTGSYYRFLYLNQSLQEITSEPNLRLATYFPLSLWKKLQIETEDINEETVLTFILFRNDLLFASPTAGHRPSNRVLDISIPNFSGELPEDIPFVFRSCHHQRQEKPICGFWNHTTFSWTTSGVKTEYGNNSGENLLICHSNHLSNFAALIGVSILPLSDYVILNIIHEEMLDYISIFGCGLSLFGLLCIWLTAICFRSWREKSSNKVLLNMSLVLSLIMTFFLFLNLPEPWKSFINMKNIVHCIIIGGFLHYNILVLFTWMLIVAIMQYQRYVTVLGYDRPSKFIKKFALIAWGLPLVPTFLVAYLDPYTYMPSAEQLSSKTGICYPSGNCLYYGVILPIAVIMMANLFIFIYIFYSLRRSLNQFKRQTKQIKIQVRISILLFFLLGISWIFGLLSHLESSPVFSYLFCFTSTLQGFVLFIYFIIIDETTRYSWLMYCCAKNYYPNEEISKRITENEKSRLKQ